MINNKNKNLLGNLLESHHCMCCKSCCKFSEQDFFDAPMFTNQEKLKISKKFPGTSFHRINKLWKINLELFKKTPKKKYICPLYDNINHRCLIYNYRPFDCLTWPFYIMKINSRIFITLSRDCPTVLENNLDFLINYASRIIAPYMIKMAKKYPDLITKYHNEAVVLFEVTNKIKNK